MLFRKQRLDSHIAAMPANIALRTHLLALGYSPALWTADLQVEVEIDSTRDFDTLLAKALAQYAPPPDLDLAIASYPTLTPYL